MPNVSNGTSPGGSVSPESIREVGRLCGLGEREHSPFETLEITDVDSLRISPIEELDRKHQEINARLERLRQEDTEERYLSILSAASQLVDKDFMKLVSAATSGTLMGLWNSYNRPQPTVAEAIGAPDQQLVATRGQYWVHKLCEFDDRSANGGQAISYLWSRRKGAEEKPIIRRVVDVIAAHADDLYELLGLPRDCPIPRIETEMRAIREAMEVASRQGVTDPDGSRRAVAIWEIIDHLLIRKQGRQYQQQRYKVSGTTDSEANQQLIFIVSESAFCKRYCAGSADPHNDPRYKSMKDWKEKYIEPIINRGKFNGLSEEHIVLPMYAGLALGTTAAVFIARAIQSGYLLASNVGGGVQAASLVLGHSIAPVLLLAGATAGLIGLLSGQWLRSLVFNRTTAALHEAIELGSDATFMFAYFKDVRDYLVDRGAEILKVDQGAAVARQFRELMENIDEKTAQMLDLGADTDAVQDLLDDAAMANKAGGEYGKAFQEVNQALAQLPEFYDNYLGPFGRFRHRSLKKEVIAATVLARTAAWVAKNWGNFTPTDKSTWLGALQNQANRIDPSLATRLAAKRYPLFDFANYYGWGTAIVGAVWSVALLF